MKPRILIIDDDPFTREALAAILQRVGYEVISLEGGREGELDPLKQHFQVAVLDYHLPAINGLELARRFKERRPELRIIMISAKLPEGVELAGSSVVDRFLAKPFSKDAILEAIAQFCPPPAT